jgi:cobalt-zinc-cadmium efflux system membrane fusion protein
MNFTQRAIAPLVLALVVAGCGSQPAEQEKAEKEEGHAGEEGLIRTHAPAGRRGAN